MLILIEKDAATKVSKEVADIDAARAYADMGFAVLIINDDGTYSPLDAPVVEAAPTAAPAVKKAKAKKR